MPIIYLAKRITIVGRPLTIPYWIRALLPIILALFITGVILLCLGKDPLTFYWNVIDRSLVNSWGLQDSLNRMTPLLLIGAALIVSFRAGMWNIGLDGQFVLSAVFASAIAPLALTVMPSPLAMFCLVSLGILVALIWSIGPALLKAYFQINEIITTLMMTFLGVLLSALLVKTVFNDPENHVHQTVGFSIGDRWPLLFGSSVHVGLIIAFIAILTTHFFVSKTSVGNKLRIVGINPKAAAHAGLSVPKFTIAAFAVSAALTGLAGTIEVAGRIGHIRAGWDPHYGLYMIPFVFLARFNGLALIGFTAFFAAFSIGGEYAARKAQLPSVFVLIIIGLILVFLALTEYLNQKFENKS